MHIKGNITSVDDRGASAEVELIPESEADIESLRGLKAEDSFEIKEICLQHVVEQEGQNELPLGKETLN